MKTMLWNSDETGRNLINPLEDLKRFRRATGGILKGKKISPASVDGFDSGCCWYREESFSA